MAVNCEDVVAEAVLGIPADDAIDNTVKAEVTGKKDLTLLAKKDSPIKNLGWYGLSLIIESTII